MEASKNIYLFWEEVHHPSQLLPHPPQEIHLPQHPIEARLHPVQEEKEEATGLEELNSPS